MILTNLKYIFYQIEEIPERLSISPFIKIPFSTESSESDIVEGSDAVQELEKIQLNSPSKLGADVVGRAVNNQKARMIK